MAFYTPESATGIISVNQMNNQRYSCRHLVGRDGDGFMFRCFYAKGSVRAGAPRCESLERTLAHEPSG